ncbi:hypothetical protein LCGC14_1016210 [marine sediment metagenome]|uniref:Uncharacterized protein n=1 Tax=marine sediment metagenome TaxID=412755 RepID=A0A0F9N3B5_9ZZZZ
MNKAKRILGPFKVEQEDGSIKEVYLEARRVVGNHFPMWVTRPVKT